MIKVFLRISVPKFLRTGASETRSVLGIAIKLYYDTRVMNKKMGNTRTLCVPAQ